MMNPAALNVIAALSGTALGSFAPILSNYVLQKSITQRDLLNRQLGLRESLYSDFIQNASRLYADAMIHELSELNELVALYALVSRIRLLATPPVVRAAEEFVKMIVRHYGEPNITVDQIRSSALAAKADPLAVFSAACCKELRDILRRGELSGTISK
ncbi:hypothetical protein [Terriglobus saanensis]|uniref:Uncharacterized protein n=1 Tax=Terriglobus saanensis (strain ATCC BAA-1853 / DSM 23119 / SP1PR4) TaxID=401053 RepID=E8V442_TERSS|nr:hypothetical protein [Terriglobus saanensis]ADV82533.1 hypothetical protein AciPR4_1726 [Terriglobus saanensis SP1PR4]